MNKTYLTIIIASLLAASLAVGVLVWGVRYGPATTVSNKNEITCTDELDTRCWQTYRNEEYGFEFKYPSEWMVDEHNETEKNNLTYKLFTISLYDKTNFPSINIKISDNITDLSSVDNKVEVLNIAGVEGYKYTEEYGEDTEGGIFNKVTTVRIIKNNKVFNFYLGESSFHENERKELYQNTFDKILEHFTFAR